MATIHLQQCVCGALHDSYSVRNCGPAQFARAEAAEKALELLREESNKTISLERSRTESAVQTERALVKLLRTARPFVSTWDTRYEECESCGWRDGHDALCVLTRIDAILDSTPDDSLDGNTVC